MDAEALKALQAPIKEQYKDTPDAALITLVSESNGSDGVACKLETSKGMVAPGLLSPTG